jgi:hypothetical protein
MIPKAWLVCVSIALQLAPVPARTQGAPPDSPQAQKIVALVEKAAALVSKQGKAAFAEFRKPDSEWFSGTKYLFAYDMKANVLLNPAFLKREGTNVAGQTDGEGLGLGRLHVPEARRVAPVAQVDVRQARRFRRRARTARRRVLPGLELIS